MCPFTRLKPYIACLWTDSREITKEVISGGIGVREFDSSFNISETDDGKAVTTNEKYCTFDDFGQRLLLKKVGEDYHRMVGPMVDCFPTTYVRLTDYLDWIEETVWPRKT